MRENTYEATVILRRVNPKKRIKVPESRMTGFFQFFQNRR
jgi:hypothetical protein